jgi:hypothetical protein
MASRVYNAFFSAFLFPGGAPDPGAPPCIQHRFFPRTAPAKQGLPERVLAPTAGATARGYALVVWRVANFEANVNWFILGEANTPHLRWQERHAGLG